MYLDISEDFFAHNRNILAEILSEIPGLMSSRVGELAIRVSTGAKSLIGRRSTHLPSPFEDEGELGEMANSASGLLLGVDGLELSLSAREFDLASEGLVELSQFVEILPDCSEALRFLDCRSDLNQLLALSKDDFFGFVVEKTNEGPSPWFVDREVELELLLWGAIRVPEDSHVRLEDPSGRLWGGLYGERALGRCGEALKANAR